MADRSLYDKLFGAYQQRVATAPQFEQQLNTAVGTATNNNMDLLNRKAQISTDIRSLPDQLRVNFANSNIRNPLEQEALGQQQLGTLQSAYGNTIDVLGERKGRFQDILGSVLKQYGADTQSMGMGVDKAYQDYKDQMSADQYAQDLALRKAALARSGGGDHSFDTSAGAAQLAQQMQQHNKQFGGIWQRIQKSKSPQERQQLASSMLNLLPDTDFANNQNWYGKLYSIAGAPAQNSVTGDYLNNLLAKQYGSTR